MPQIVFPFDLLGVGSTERVFFDRVLCPAHAVVLTDRRHDGNAPRLHVVHPRRQAQNVKVAAASHGVIEPCFSM